MARIICINILLTLFFISKISFSQTQFDPDSLFGVARNQSGLNDYDNAISTCNKILEKYPNYNDVRVYLGTIYSWNKRYNEARKELSLVLEKDSLSREATVALINTELWSDNPEQAMKISDKWLKYQKHDIEIMFLKIKSLDNQKKYKDAIAVTDTILKIDKNNIKVLDIKKDLRVSDSKNAISINYYNDSYKKFTPRHLFYIDYSRRTSIGTIIGRINYAERFGNKGYQYEIDAFPKYSKNSYGYINAGYSDSLNVFPHYRFGSDFYYNLPKAFEISAGFRYMKFTSDVTIFTGHIGKYIGNYWFSLRPFITPGNTGTSFSGIFQLRRYFSSSKDYLGLSFGYGSSPDDKRDYFDVIHRLISRKIKIEYCTHISSFWIFNISSSLGNEEYFPGIYRGIYSVGIGIERIF
ncbi:MAG: YaiO family outer membrane beta-barrel protein [Bacteroidota bacterium]|nr:YaiO family outer membrane beta-barrel protein [Bacteroidota bacterium]